MSKYLVIALYDDYDIDPQRYATIVEAENPDGAERAAQVQALLDNGVIESAEEYTAGEGWDMLFIAAVIQAPNLGAVKVVG